MKITVERTRIIFTEYTHEEKRRIEDIVATDEKAFLYQDPDDLMICFPPGMLDVVKTKFRHVPIVDHTKSYWDYEKISPVEHNAKPRNQLQIDCISSIMKAFKEGKKAAAIVSPGTGKANSVKSIIPVLNGEKLMGDIVIGDRVIGTDGKPKLVTGVYPQGVKDIYQITLINGINVECTVDHLWQVKNNKNNKIEVVSLCRLMRRHYKDYSIPVGVPQIYIPILSIKYLYKDEAQCIMIDSPDHLYMTNNEVFTHNTFMACYCAIELGTRTLIIAPTSGIKVQWAETLIKMFNVDPSKVKLVNSPRDFINVTSDFVVVSQASLAVLNNKYNLEKIMRDNKFGMKVIDEVQMWFHNIVKVDGNSNICNNLYLTGTFGRSGDEENNLYQHMFGDLSMFREKDKTPTIFNRKPGNIYGMKPHMNIKMIWTKSGLSKEEISSIMTSIRYSERSGKWVRYGISIPAHTNLVIPDDGTMTRFLNTILKVLKNAENEVTYGKTLILGSTINSIEIVAKYVEKMFPNKKVFTYHSRRSKYENDEAKAKADILISTISSCGTGFDLKGLSKLVVFAQYKSWILTDQISGRLRRLDSGQDTYMWDIVDAQVGQLRAWANARADVEKRKSKTFKVVDM